MVIMKLCFVPVYVYVYVSVFASDLSIVPFPVGSESKESGFNVGDLGLIPGSGRSPGETNGNPLQYSCLENLMDRGAWWAIVHGVTKSLDMTEQLTFLLSLLLELVR